jgi:hypothetical protein
VRFADTSGVDAEEDIEEVGAIEPSIGVPEQAAVGAAQKTIIESAEPVGVVMHDAYPKDWVHGVVPSVGAAGESEVVMECRVEGLQDADTIKARSNIFFPIQAYCSRRLHDEKHAVKGFKVQAFTEDEDCDRGEHGDTRCGTWESDMTRTGMPFDRGRLSQDMLGICSAIFVVCWQKSTCMKLAGDSYSHERRLRSKHDVVAKGQYRMLTNTAAVGDRCKDIVPKIGMELSIPFDPPGRVIRSHLELPTCEEAF